MLFRDGLAIKCQFRFLIYVSGFMRVNEDVEMAHLLFLMRKNRRALAHENEGIILILFFSVVIICLKVCFALFKQNCSK